MYFIAFSSKNSVNAQKTTRSAGYRVNDFCLWPTPRHMPRFWTNGYSPCSQSEHCWGYHYSTVDLLLNASEDDGAMVTCIPFPVTYDLCYLSGRHHRCTLVYTKRELLFLQLYFCGSSHSPSRHAGMLWISRPDEETKERRKWCDE